MRNNFCLCCLRERKSGKKLIWFLQKGKVLSVCYWSEFIVTDFYFLHHCVLPTKINGVESLTCHIFSLAWAAFYCRINSLNEQVNGMLRHSLWGEVIFFRCSTFLLLPWTLMPCLSSSPRSEPALQLHSRAASSVGGTSLFPQSQHRKQFWRRADN